ncbi:hypothetical protein P1P68_16055 [Streptomyces scabiei]|uniref:hypothetical protein n=1 Tax=Streptomyces scabiei TaxID=1930 RepID=UPI00298F964A|nr:hypothetical protein [Streptomyces scabiei]MDW8806255.1 hypothetical protein [Streptomyces scabiei]
MVGDVVLPSARPAVSGYLHQVRRLAASHFQGRERELAAMAAFCAAPEDSVGAANSWWRWLAPAWAGKTALMARFVLEPPPETVVVSFFITGRLAGQNNRAAFCEVVQRQLCAVLEEEEPPVTEYTRDEILLHTLDRTAARCAAKGQRLLLLVDGLDEDSGVDTSGGGHSIAALLPAVPPHGARIVVAGRPHPPIPNDVPLDPLRTEVINHRLDRSPYAAAVRAEAENVLDSVLESGGLVCELLGLIGAAGGGLTAEDLAHLTSSRPTLVRRALAGAAGRVFLTSPCIWLPGGEVYLLGHEEIQRVALEMISDVKITSYRDRLHAWADGYGMSGWPASTPEYLLRGYPELLRATANAERLARLAADSSRHRRLWQTTGSDLEALTEITAALDLQCATAGPEGPDIDTVLSLAIHRDDLHERSDNVPLDLITAWLTLGRTNLAINLALAQPKPLQRVQTLLMVLRTLADSQGMAADESVVDSVFGIAQVITTLNPPGWARGEAAGVLSQVGLHDQAIEMVSTLIDPYERAAALCEVSAALAHESRFQQAAELATEADAIARTISEPYKRASVLCEVSAALAQAGRSKQAIEVAVEASGITHTITDSEKRAQGLVGVVRAQTALGQREEAAQTAKDAFEIVRSITAPEEQAQMLIEVSRVLTRVGQCEQAAEAARQAFNRAGETLHNPRSDDDLYEGAWVQGEAVGALARSGDQEEALSITRTITAAEVRARVLERLSRALTLAGWRQQAVQAAEEALEVACTIADSGERMWVQGEVAGALARAGEYEEALRVARSITEHGERSWPLGEVADALAQAGQYEWAAEVATEAAEAARACTDLDDLVMALAEVANVAAETGQSEVVSDLITAGVQIVRRNNDPEWQAKVLAESAGAMARIGEYEQGVELVTEACRIIRTRVDPVERASALFETALTTVRIGLPEQAIEIAHTLDDPGPRDRVLVAAADGMVRLGLVGQAVELAASVVEPVERAWILSGVAGALAATGQDEEAINLVTEASDIADNLANAEQQAWLLSALADGMVRLGLVGQAVELAASVVEPVERAWILSGVAGALAETRQDEEVINLATEAMELARHCTGPKWSVLARAAVVMARVGRHNQAVEAARTISDPEARTSALAKLASEYGASVYGRSLLAEVLQARPWRHSLNILLHVAPESVSVAARHLQDLIHAGDENLGLTRRYWRSEVPRTAGEPHQTDGLGRGKLPRALSQDSCQSPDSMTIGIQRQS